MIWPVARRGPPRQYSVPETAAVAAEDMLAQATWQTISWRTGTKGKLKARFAAVRVRVADGPRRGIRGKTRQCVPGEEVWLVGEHRASGEKKYYLANLPEKTNLRTLAETIKGRWICEQAHQQLKEELGLDHFEGRSWQGLHRHALMTMIAYAFLQYRRLKTARRGRGTCEQWIKEGKGVIKWTRLSCRTFAANAVRLQLHALAYNLGNFLRTLATPEPIKDWSLTSLKEKLIKIGAKVVSHGRYVVFQMAEVAIARQMFQEILRLIAELRSQPPPAPA